VLKGPLDINVELRVILKDAVVSTFKALLQRLPGGTGTIITCLRYEPLNR
jgi:hypothetical protein